MRFVLFICDDFLYVFYYVHDASISYIGVRGSPERDISSLGTLDGGWTGSDVSSVAALERSGTT